MRRDKGFTLVELLVVTIIFGIVAAILSAIFIQSRRSKIATELVAEAQQNVRIAVDLMSAEIRSAGYGVDWDLEQGAVVHAGPYDIVFNANLNPYPDTDPPSAPAAMNIDKTPDQVPPGVSDPHYEPEVSYLTGAETIRYTLDATNDKLVDSGDRGSGWAARTRNPNDYLLIKQVYGYNVGENNNGGQNQGIAILRGPDDQWPNQGDSLTPPLFEYWWDHDEDVRTPDSLFGDLDADGELSWAEFEALDDSIVPYPERISRVTINGVGETKSPMPDGSYQQVKVTTTVSVMRNPNPHRYTLYGHVYHDTGENGQYDPPPTDTGLANFRVTIGAGLFDYTEADSGWYEFSLVPGTFTVKAMPNPGWDLTTPAETTIEIHTSDLDLRYDRHFGMKKIPTGFVGGYVFYDSIPDSTFDMAVERGIEGVTVSCPTMGTDTTTDENGWYMLEVNCQADSHTVKETDLPGWLSTTPNEVRFVIAVADSGDTVPINFGDVYFSSECSVYVWVPNGGEVYYTGDTTEIRWWASDSLDRIDSAQIYLSTNGGLIYDDTVATGLINWSLAEPWNASYTWLVPAKESDTCKIMVKVWDRGHDPPNSCWDESDGVFEIHMGSETGVYYFRNDTSGIYLASGDTIRLFQNYPGDNTDSAYCFAIGDSTGEDTNMLYYYAPNPTEDDTAAWVTDTFSVDTTISPGNWTFVLWGTVQRVDTFPNALYHYLGVLTYRYRDGSRDSLLFGLRQEWPGLSTVWEPHTLTKSVPDSVHFQAGDRLWVEVWTLRGAWANPDTLEVKFGYNGPTDYSSHFRLPGH